MEIRKLSKAARSAAMRGGTDCWGQRGSVRDVRYMEPSSPASRRRCGCGCKLRVSHMGMANGVALTTGCELSIRRWVKTGSANASRCGEAP